MRKNAALILVICATALGGVALGGCGIRGSLEAPEEAKAVGEGNSAANADAGSTSAAPPKPHRPFILDGLLR